MNECSEFKKKSFLLLFFLKKKKKKNVLKHETMSFYSQYVQYSTVCILCLCSTLNL